MYEPENLFHYTDAAGLIGIVSNSSPPEPWTSEISLRGGLNLRASDVRYLNDSAELHFGAEVMADRLLTMAKESEDLSGDAVKALQSLAAELADDRIEIDWDTHRSRLAIHAACFCEDGDLLSQWRGYGAHGGGYAIGIPREMLANRTFRFSQGVFMMQVELHRVWYGREQAMGVADATVDHLLDPMPDSLPPIEGDRVTDFARTSVMHAIAEIKDEGFAEENEWRLIAETSGYDFTEFRPSPKGVIPYIDVYINPKTVSEEAALQHLPSLDEAQPTISQLVVGPGPDQELRVDAVKRLLLKNGHNPDVVVGSKVPYRP
jgi:hypothetical protein